jgi:hypothetical protein
MSQQATFCLLYYYTPETPRRECLIDSCVFFAKYFPARLARTLLLL